jgi:hypothetical protein
MQQTALADRYYAMGDTTNMLFSVICGGLALRSVARTHEWLKPQHFTNRPLFLHRVPAAPVLVTIGFWITLSSAALLGWRYSGWPGIVIRPFLVALASLLLDFAIERTLPPRLRYTFPLSPIVHLFIFPYVFLAGSVFIFIRQRP